jgi:hypothetical protein
VTFHFALQSLPRLQRGRYSTTPHQPSSPLAQLHRPRWLDRLLLADNEHACLTVNQHSLRMMFLLPYWSISCVRSSLVASMKRKQ